MICLHINKGAMYEIWKGSIAYHEVICEISDVRSVDICNRKLMAKQNGQRLLVPFKLHETMSVCKAYPVGAMVTNEDNRPRPLKVILSSEQDLDLLLSRKKKLASLRLTFFFGRWRKKFSAGPISARRILSSATARLYHAPSYRNHFYGGRQ